MPFQASRPQECGSYRQRVDMHIMSGIGYVGYINIVATLCYRPQDSGFRIDAAYCFSHATADHTNLKLCSHAVELLSHSPRLRYSVHGDLSLYLSEPSCVSCIGAPGRLECS